MTEFKSRVKLKDIRVSWVNGELHRNGVLRTEKQVVESLQNKHKMFGCLVPLTNDELNDIIYKDPSRYRQKLAPQDDIKVRMKKLELEAKILDIKKLKQEYRIKTSEDEKKRLRANELAQQLMEDSNPTMFGLEMYQRMKPEYCMLAIQSVYPDLTQRQCKLIIGSWVRKGY